MLQVAEPGFHIFMISFFFFEKQVLQKINSNHVTDPLSADFMLPIWGLLKFPQVLFPDSHSSLINQKSGKVVHLSACLKKRCD